MIPATNLRRFHDAGHMPPASGLDHVGARWKGTSRIVDPAARRARNRRTWRAELHKTTKHKPSTIERADAIGKLVDQMTGRR